jgi:glycosyltransferase involved in cell wall biosynthesis
VELSKHIEGLESANFKVLRNYFGIAFGLIKELLKDDSDVIVDSYLSKEAILSVIIAKLRDKPIILWSEDWDWEKRNTPREKLISVLANWIIAHTDAFVVPGTRHKKYLVSLGALPEHIFIMPNATNVIVQEDDCLIKEQIKENLKIGNKKIVLFVGRLTKRKGVDYLIKAFAKLSREIDETILVIVGKGECRHELEQLSKDLNVNDNIYFIGYVDNKALAPYYLLCNIFVTPSITYGMADPWVLTINEAMYFRKPVIATDAVGAAFDMIKDGENGFMVPERDSDALCSAMMKILSNPELERKMGEESKKIIENGYTYDHMVEGFNKAIEYVKSDRVKM